MINGVQLGARLLVLWGILRLCGCALVDDGNEEIISVSTRFDQRHAIKFNAAGVTHYEAGHPQMAVTSFENALCHNPNFGPALNNMGRVHFDKNDLFQAAMAFEKAMELMPGNPLPMNNLGLVFESAGRIDEAIELYGMAHEIEPTCAEFLGNLVRARIRMGERDESIREQLKHLLFIDTRPDWIEWAEQLLALDLNPALDRGIAGPDFNEFDSPDRDERPWSIGEPLPRPADPIPLPEPDPTPLDAPGPAVPNPPLPQSGSNSPSQQAFPEPEPSIVPPLPPSPGQIAVPADAQLMIPEPRSQPVDEVSSTPSQPPAVARGLNGPRSPNAAAAGPLASRPAPRQATAGQNGWRSTATSNTEVFTPQFQPPQVKR